MKFSRQGDKWLMRKFAKAGYQREDMKALNRVRLYMQVIFLSDILGASGRSLDPKYLRKRPHNEQWSRLTYPNKQPPDKHFQFRKAPRFGTGG